MSLRVVIISAVLGYMAASGCVHRRMTFRSSPPGALVFVDNQQVGRTPVSTGFTYYGTRNIRLELDGYETLEVQQKFPTPWYQYPPADFVSENLTPWDVRDERVLDFQLVPQAVVPTEQLLERANHLRNSTRLGVVSPLPNIPPGSLRPLPPTGVAP